MFVDFENGLNTATNRLRIALGDSAENPRYIETLTRTGYRFIAPLEVVEPSSVAPTQPSEHGTHLPLTFPVEHSSPFRRHLGATVTASVLIVGTIGTLFAFWSLSDTSLRFRQVTFRRGQIWGARFAPDGQSILYTANWDNGPRRLFLTNSVSPESRTLGFDDLRLVSVSQTGELALLSFDGTMPLTGGALSRVRMNGGAPSPVERNVMSADWAPDGRLAIVHALDGTNQLEFPVGTVVLEFQSSTSTRAR